MAYVPNSSSVVAFQSDPTKLVGTVSVVGTLPVTLSGNPSISGTVNIGTNSGSVVAFQGTNPWIITGSVQASLTPAANQSVSGTVGASIIGTVPVTMTGVGSVITVAQSSVAVAIISGSIAATFTPPANQSVSGTVGASIIGQLPAGTAPLGSVAALQGTMPWTISSVYGNISGSVVAFQGTVPWTVSSVYGNVSGSVVAFQGSGWSGSVAATITNTNVNVSGSVVSSQGTNPWVIGSIVGTYGEDIPSTAADKGLFTLGIRNDTVASLVGADLDYTGWSTDSAGRHLTKPFAAEESRLSTVSSVVSASVTALFTSVTGLRNYVTDVMVANTGSVSTLVTFKDGSTSILGFTIAPAGGGSNINGMQFPMRTAPAQDFTYTATTSSSVLYVTAFGYKAP